VTYLSKEDIFKAEDLPTRDLEVPEWGGTVRVRALDGVSRGEYDASLQEQRADGTFTVNLIHARAKLASLCIVNENGDPMFSVGDVGRLGQKSAAALDRVAALAAELSALPGTTTETDLEGNSDAAPSGDSGSTSPEN
jgi:hypothetical protein